MAAKKKHFDLEISSAPSGRLAKDIVAEFSFQSIGSIGGKDHLVCGIGVKCFLFKHTFS